MRLIHAIDNATDFHIVILTTNNTGDAVEIVEATVTNEENLWAVIDDLDLSVTPQFPDSGFHDTDWPIDRGLPVDLPLIPDLQ